MSKLTRYKLSDLYEMSSGISSTKEQAGHGDPFVSFSTVFNNFFLPEELPDLMDTSSKEQETFSVKKDDVFITRTSETVDALAMSCVAVKDYPKATFSGFVKRLRPKKEGIVYSRYIAFFLRSKYFRKVLDCNTIMTLRASFNEDIFSFLYLYLPNYEEPVSYTHLDVYKRQIPGKATTLLTWLGKSERPVPTTLAPAFLARSGIISGVGLAMAKRIASLFIEATISSETMLGAETPRKISSLFIASAKTPF